MVLLVCVLGKRHRYRFDQLFTVLLVMPSRPWPAARSVLHVSARYLGCSANCRRGELRQFGLDAPTRDVTHAHAADVSPQASINRCQSARRGPDRAARISAALQQPHSASIPTPARRSEEEQPPRRRRRARA